MNNKPASLNQKDYSSAANCSDRVLAKNGNNVEALIIKSAALSGLGKYEDARSICDSMIARDEGNAIAWYNNACFESKLCNSDEALTSLKKAIELNKEFIEQAKTEEDFTTLRTNARFQKLIETESAA